MILGWIAEKLGLGSIGKYVLEIMAVLLVVAGLVGYHYEVVNSIQKQLTTAVQDQQVLRDNNKTLTENVEKMQAVHENDAKILKFVEDSQNFLQNLEANYDKEQEKKEADRNAFQKKVAADAQVLGNKPVSPLLAKVLNDLNMQDNALQPVTTVGEQDAKK